MEDILFLLSKEETELFTKEQLEFDTWWWLRSPFRSYSDSVWNVGSGGGINYDYAFSSGGVCPAFKSEILNLKNLPDKITLGEFCGTKMEWVLSKDKNLYKLKNYIVSSVFSFTDNNYETSHIRKIVKSMEMEFVKALKNFKN